MFRCLILFFLAFAVGNSIYAAGIGEVRCEYRINPEGIDNPNPRLNWLILSNQRGEIQTAYQVLVASSSKLLAADKGDLWDSGRVPSNQSAEVEYAGEPLSSRAACFWKVRIWDRNGKPSGWSRPASWSMGLLKSSDWSAQWIGDSILADPANRPLTPIYCYRSELASRSDAAKWIVLDLGEARSMDAIEMSPARPQKENTDFRTALFPFQDHGKARPTFHLLRPRRVICVSRSSAWPVGTARILAWRWGAWLCLTDRSLSLSEPL
jgi:hypothetical protein